MQSRRRLILPNLRRKVCSWFVEIQVQEKQRSLMRSAMRFMGKRAEATAIRRIWKASTWIRKWKAWSIFILRIRARTIMCAENRALSIPTEMASRMSRQKRWLSISRMEQRSKVRKTLMERKRSQARYLSFWIWMPDSLCRLRWSRRENSGSR